MPEPIIELQRRLTIVGAIRAGGQKPQPKRVGPKLENWRITSPRQQLIEQAATLYGGTISEWESPVGTEFQVYTETDELPVLLMPDYSLRQTYELWEGATKRMRLCDGVDEELSGGPCICNAEHVDKCDLYTRLVVALPELDTLLGWRVITRGANAAHELPTMLAAAQMTSGGKQFVPARLRLDQRRGVVNGQVARFVVPTLDLGVGYAALAASAAPSAALSSAVPAALPLGATATRHEPTVEEALNAADSSQPRAGGRRRAAAFGAEDDVDVDDARAPAVTDGDPPPGEQTFRISEGQKTKLDVLVGTLRDGGHITTDGVYAAIGKLRDKTGVAVSLSTPDYIDGNGEIHPAVDADGRTHWAPLRETLTRPEAHQLIEWLVEKERRVEAPSAAGGRSEPQGGTGEAFPIPEAARQAQHGSMADDPFPPGY